jgi:hypothetical protein
MTESIMVSVQVSSSIAACPNEQHITTESYRLEDLQSGLVRVSHVAGRCDAIFDAHDRFSFVEQVFRPMTQ